MTRADLAEWRRRAEASDTSVSGEIRQALRDTSRLRADEALRREVRDTMHAINLVVMMLEGGGCTLPEAAKWLKEAIEAPGRLCREETELPAGLIICAKCRIPVPRYYCNARGICEDCQHD